MHSLGGERWWCLFERVEGCSGCKRSVIKDALKTPKNEPRIR
jgi:hypothetical protein